MNAFYNWANDEIMATERMKDIQREAEKVRLFHAAGLSKTNLYDRMAVSFGNALVKFGERLQRTHAHANQCQTAGSKYAV